MTPVGKRQRVVRKIQTAPVSAVPRYRSAVDRIPGWSIFCIDPGVSSGWVWVCVGKKEVARYGVEAALLRVKEEPPNTIKGSSPGDVRFRMGEVKEPEAWVNASELMVEMLVCQHMASRVTGGKISQMSSVTCESFTFREKTKSRYMLVPIRVAAMFEAYLRIGSETRDIAMDYRSSSDSKSTVTDERLRRWGLWVPGDDHRRDAMRLAIITLRRLAGAG